MSDDIKVLPDIIPDIKFNLEAQEQFGNDKGIVFEHYAAIPSTIGKKSKGDYRRPDSLDTISDNGFLYKKVGEFVGTIVSNSKNHSFEEGGLFDASSARLVLPKYYKETESGEKKEIALLPGDRIYAKDIEVRVPNYQQVEYRPNSVDVLQFPVKSVELLTDSRNIDYVQGRHFKITDEGNIKWLDGQKNPGVDTETGLGRLYSVRYTYIAFWYIERLINEIRITNMSDSSEPARLPYHVMIQREYVYHNKLNGDKKKEIANKKKKTPRKTKKPAEKIQENQYDIKVDIRDFGE